MKKRTFKHFIITICIVVLSITLIGFSVFSAYTNINKVKRVVSTQGGSGVAFSSNYLALINNTESNFELKRISIPQNAESVEFAITVCNYVHNNPSLFNSNDISYNIEIKLFSALNNELVTDDKGLSVQKLEEATFYSFQNGVCEIIEQNLKGKEKSTNTYRITVPRSFIDDKVNIQVKAVPTDNSLSYTDNYILARKFTFTEYSENTTTWTGSFVEKNPNDYDGFNYIITGHGEGTIQLKWNSTKLEISKVFLDNNNLIPYEEENYKTISFEVNSNEKNRYNIQFYKTGNDNDLNLDNNVLTTFTEKQSD